eukprot:665217-Pyramimonas_sp.AAC.1
MRNGPRFAPSASLPLPLLHRPPLLFSDVGGGGRGLSRDTARSFDHDCDGTGATGDDNVGDHWGDD